MPLPANIRNFFVAVMLTLACAGTMATFLRKGPVTHQSAAQMVQTESLEPPAWGLIPRVSADKLLIDFQNNGVDADLRYGGRRYMIYGTVGQVRQEAEGGAAVLLSSPMVNGLVVLETNHRFLVSGLRSGDTVGAACDVIGSPAQYGGLAIAAKGCTDWSPLHR